MGYADIRFEMSEEVRALGVRGVYLAVGGLNNRESDLDFEHLKESAVRQALAGLSAGAIENDQILRGFRQLHEAVGRAGKKNISSPENLLGLLLKTGRLPHVNLLVDIYNLVSIKTRLALGAHDIAAISGNVHLRLTTGAESFLPLGYDKPKPVGPGEYSYIDDNNDVICRLETRQVEKTKVLVTTTECFYIIQGSPATDDTYLKSATEELLTLTKRFCGGEERVLYAPWQ